MRRFKFQNAASLVIRVHPEPLSVAALRLQSTSFAHWNQLLRHSPNSNPLCSDCRRWFPCIALRAI